MLTCCSYRGKHISFQRAKHSIRPNTSLIKIEGVDDTKAATFYNGKRIAYVYRGKKEIRGTKIRVIWGKVTRPHGTFSHTTHTHCWRRMEERDQESRVAQRQADEQHR